MKIKTIILAAGQGTRMRSTKPKVLHKISGKALLEHVYDMSVRLDNNTINVVYGHGAEMVLQELQTLDVNWIEQEEQLGTGHAVKQAIEYIDDKDIVLILYGDVPLLKLETVKKLLAKVSENFLGLLTVKLKDPKGYGRIVRNDRNQVVKIVEDKDATDAIKRITEVNTGIISVTGNQLKNWLLKLENNNVQNEYYLTDIIEMAVQDGVGIETVQAETLDEVLGVNDRQQLSHLERVIQHEQAELLMRQGVTFYDPSRFDLRGTIHHIGTDVEIDVNVIFEGDLKIGDNVKIGENTIIKNSMIEDNVEILPNCVIEDAKVGAGSRIGPFARLRPETELSSHVHIGNFVEVKKSKVAEGSKINHLSYIGDTIIGSRVNIGAGTITCNYDGVSKFQTVIGDGAFIGSDSQLVAPVTIGKNATIGAGSTITKNTPEDQLTLTRSKQITLKSWQRPVKQEK